MSFSSRSPFSPPPRSENAMTTPAETSTSGPSAASPTNDVNAFGPLAADPLRRFIRLPKSSYVWEYIHRLEVPQRNKRGKMAEFCCSVCVQSGRMPWPDCLIVLHKQNAANGASHLTAKHPELVIAAASTASKRSSVKAHVKLTSTNSKASAKASLKPTASSVSVVDLPVVKRRDNALDLVQIQLVQWLVARGLPLSTLETDQELLALLQTASQLKPGGFVPLQRAAAEGVVRNLFALFVQTTQRIVADAREQHAGVAGALAPNPGFVTILHDKPGRNISLAFVNPSDWTLHRIACGASRKPALNLPTALEEAYSRFGVVATDVLQTVDDRTETPPPTVSGTQNKTQRIQAVLDDAMTSKAFPVFSLLQQKLQDLALYVSSRHELYVQSCVQAQLQAVRLPLLEAARDLTTMHQQLQCALRAYNCLDVFFWKESRAIQSKYMLSRQQWTIVAECEALLRALVKLATETTSEAGSPSTTLSTSWLRNVVAHRQTFKSTYDIVDVLCLPPDGTAKSWDNATPFKQLPKIKMTADVNAGSASARVKLMSDEAVELRDRLSEAFKRFLPEDPDDDQLLAAMCDPVMVSGGLRFLSALKDQAINAKIDRAWMLLDQEVLAEAQRCTPTDHKAGASAASHGQTPLAGVVLDEDEEEDDLFNQVMAIEPSRPQRSSAAPSSVTARPAAVPQPEQRARSELSEWRKLQLDWPRELTLQGLTEDQINTQQAAVSNPIYLAKVFDVLQWFQRQRSVDPGRWWYIARVAARRLGKPDADATPTFAVQASTAASETDGETSIDEMRSLLAANAVWIKRHTTLDLTHLRSCLQVKTEAEPVASSFQHQRPVDEEPPTSAKRVKRV